VPFDDDTRLTVSQVDDNRWRLERDLLYHGRSDTFRVPAGFTTDFASVPRPLWWLVPRYGRFTRSTVLHDHLWGLADAGRISRCDADGIFRRSMNELGVPFLQRWIMWAAVRLGGVRRRWTEPLRCGPASALAFGVIAVPTFAFVLPVALATVIFLGLFWVLEGMAALVLGSIARRPVNMPRRIWYSESARFPKPFPSPASDGDPMLWQDQAP
jgi:hypothetical protein